MIYVYDFLVNFNDKLYKFYEWEEKDRIYVLKKSPLYKVSKYIYREFRNGNIEVNKEFLNNIKNQTIIVKNKVNDIIEYSSIIACDKEAVALIFNSKGRIIKYSSFLLDDDREIRQIVKDLKECKINIKILNKKNNINYLTRSEENKIKETINKLESLKEDENKIKYLYYEYFNENASKDYYEKLINDIRKNNKKSDDEFYKLLDLIYYNV